MNQCSIQFPGNRRQYAQSWAVSLLFHAVAVTSAVVLLGDLKLAPEPEPFKWEVSLVQPVDQTAQTPEAQPAEPEVQPAPAKTQPPPRLQPVPVKPQTVMEPPPVQPEQKIQEEPQKEVQKVEPVVDLVQQPTTVVSQPVEPQPKVSEAPIVAASPPTPQMPQPQAKVEPQPKAEPQLKDISTSTASMPTPPAVAKEPPAPPSPIQEASIRPQAPAAAPSMKTDYGWLAKSLWDRVMHLKRYPQGARLHHLEGRVVVRAVIRKDGHLADAEVLESSGHDELDLAALEIVRRAFPLKLAKDLGRAEMAVQVPITYKLEN